jgi:F0F1-type ATP synthase membrane subunit b/b'
MGANQMRHPLFWQLLATLLIIGFILKFVWRLATAASIIAIAW